MNDLCTEIGYHSLFKYGEQLCGDHVDIVEQDDNSFVMVLADGLGSGVKACILSTLTAKIISTMMASGLSVDECVSTIVSTLPVCEKRGVAYSTFTIIRVVDCKYAQIIQYDNPHTILLRNGKNFEYPETSKIIEDKTIYFSEIALEENDALIAMSDGAIYAGVGRSMNFGWQRENIIEFMEKMYEIESTAKTLTTLLTDECNRLYGNMPGDDTTVGIIKIRKRQQVNLLFGPPSNPEDVPKMLSLFFSKEGKHIVSGGTTSKIVADFLGKELIPDMDYLDPEIPPMAIIDGVDLTTEGVITINKVLTYSENYLQDNGLCNDWTFKKDGASKIAKMLFEDATDINFFVGRAINPAHQNPELPISFSIKMNLVSKLSECLKNIGKQIKVSYF